MSHAIKFINIQYDRLRYGAFTILQELAIYNQYIIQYRIYLAKCRLYDRRLFQLANSRNRIRVNDAILVEGQLKSPTIELLLIVKKIVNGIIDHEKRMVRYANRLYDTLENIIRGLQNYRHVYVSYLDDLSP